MSGELNKQVKALIGCHLGRFRIERKLSSGTMGAVLLGVDETLGRRSAFKVLPASAVTDAKMLDRFYREAKALSKLTHPGIVRVYEWGEAQGWHFIRMQYIEALDLDRLVKTSGAAPPLQALRIMRDIADALAEAHAAKMLHRDLKPANVLYVETTDEIVVIDFGLAKFDADLSVAAQPLTMDGQILGTPQFMAPEQARGASLDERADIYSLGAIGFYLLSGSKPLEETNVFQVLLKTRRGETRKLHAVSPEVPRVVARLIDRMMAFEPERRPGSMREVCEILDIALAAAVDGVSGPERLASATKALARGLAARGLEPREEVASAQALPLLEEESESVIELEGSVLEPRRQSTAEEIRPGKPLEALPVEGGPHPESDTDVAPPLANGSVHGTASELAEQQTRVDPPQEQGPATPPSELTGWLQTAARQASQPQSFPANEGQAIPERLGMQRQVQLDKPEQAPAAEKEPGAKLPEEEGLEHVGRYRVEHQIGEGGMGAILAVRDPDLNREIALKLLLAGDEAKQSQIEKFLVEAQVTGQMEHPNIVPVHELGTDEEGRLYFTMKYLRGRSLSEITQKIKREVAERGEPVVSRTTLHHLLEVFLKVCDGVAFAHHCGVVHRDLKPDNIMVGEFGEVQVMDWGVAKVLGHEDSTRSESEFDRSELTQHFVAARWEASASSSGVEIDLAAGGVATQARGDDSTTKRSGPEKTLEGTIVGTPAYMPPEQAEGRVAAIDPRSDIYSLGAILYHLLTLERPVESGEGGVMAVLYKVTHGEIVPPIERSPKRRISPELDAVVRKAMAHGPHERYASVQQLQRDIRAFLQGHTLSAVNYSTLRRMGKWVKRNKLLTGATAAALLLASTAVGVTIHLRSLHETEQVGEFVSTAEAQLERAHRYLEEPHSPYTQTALENAGSAIDGALAIQPQAEAPRALRERFFELRVQYQAQLAQEEERRLREARREEERRFAAERRERARNLAEEARHLAQQAEDTLPVALAELERLDEAARHEAREHFFASLEQAEGLITRGEELGPEVKEVRSTRELVHGIIAEAQTRWEAAASRLARLRAAEASLATAQQNREAGEATLAKLAGLREQAETGDEQPSEALHEEFDTLRHKAFSRLLDALNAYTEALTQYETLAHTEGPVQRARKGRVAILLKLTEHALEDREFQLARTWLSQAEASPVGDTRAVETMRERLEEQWAIASGYRAAEAAGLRAFERENYSQALAHFRRAQELRDDDEIRREIERSQFALWLETAKQRATEVRNAEAAARDWHGVREALEAAKSVATTTAREQRLQIVRNDLLAEALAERLTFARNQLHDGDEASLDAARAALAQARSLDAQAPELAQLKQELQAREQRPEGFVYVAAGPVALGSTLEDERNPPRTVQLDAFYLARYEVTVEQFGEFLEAGGYESRHLWCDPGWQFVESLPEEQRHPARWEAQRDEPSLPVTGVSAYEAQAYARWRSEQHERVRLRLPDEAERELVARHSPANRTGLGNTFPWGHDFAAGGLGELREVQPTGANPHDVNSAFGVLDLGGNASEWVRQRLDSEEATQSYGFRGASNLMRPRLLERFARTTKRGFAEPETRSPMIGFRLAAELEAQPSEAEQGGQERSGRGENLPEHARSESRQPQSTPRADEAEE